MKIAVLGAGAVGTLYAARLAGEGHDVAIVARGERASALARDGLRVRPRGREVETARVPVLERVGDDIDLVIVLVRRHQVDAALEALKSARADVLVMVNTAAGYARWREALGSRLLVGFPGVVARFDPDGVLDYQIPPAAAQPTVLGEPDGGESERVAEVARVLRGAGFPVQVRRDMEAWQRTHAAWIAPFMLSAAATGGDARRLLEMELLREWTEATREALRAVRASGSPVVPPVFRLVARIPAGATARVLRVALRSAAESIAAGGTASLAEGDALTDDLLTLGELPHLVALRDRARAAAAR